MPVQPMPFDHIWRSVVRSSSVQGTRDDVLHAGWHGGAPLCYAGFRDKSENLKRPVSPV